MEGARRRPEAGLNRPPTPDRPVAHGVSEAADVALAVAGDQRAFERLYRLHVARIHSLARRMVGGDGDPDELTQDVFVRDLEGQSWFGAGFVVRETYVLIMGDRNQPLRYSSGTT